MVCEQLAGKHWRLVLGGRCPILHDQVHILNVRTQVRGRWRGPLFPAVKVRLALLLQICKFRPLLLGGLGRTLVRALAWVGVLVLRWICVVNQLARSWLSLFWASAKWLGALLRYFWALWGSRRPWLLEPGPLTLLFRRLFPAEVCLHVHFQIGVPVIVLCFFSLRVVEL